MATKKPTKTEVPATIPTGDKPSYLAQFEKRGAIKSKDTFDSSDVTIPRVKLVQALSKEIDDFGAKAGHFWHTGMDVDLGQEVTFIPVSRRKRYLLVAPLDDGRGILARAEELKSLGNTVDYIWNPPHGEFEVKLKGRKKPMVWKLAPTLGESGLSKWGTYNDEDENSPPAATLFYEYLSLLPDHLDLGPVVISLTRSQIRKAKKGLNDKIAMHASAGRPMQSLVFKAKSIKESGQEGDYYNWQFFSNGFAPEVIFKQAWDLKDALATYKVQDEADAASEEPAHKVNTNDY